MECLFPGAPNLRTFWSNIRGGVDAIGQAPASRIDPVFFEQGAREVDDPWESPKGDRFYCRRGGFVDTMATFDATAFGVMPVAARGAEPDQLLALQVAAGALADAGYHDRAFARDRAAVILGRGGYAGAGRARLEAQVRTAEQVVAVVRALLPDVDEAALAKIKQEFQGQLGSSGADAAIGLVPNLAASRIAHRLDLHGPAFTVDAACASALVAVEQGCRELEVGACDLVVCGGVHLCHDEAFWSVFCQLGALSRAGSIRPFDRRADGLLIGEGVGIFVLKRLADAERDDDRIYAVISGTGTSSDGRGATLMSPSIEGQVLALERAWRAAGLEPSSVGLIEAHGTGTPAGDTAELTTLARVFGKADVSAQRAVLGSVKSMIGHAMPAAGAAGLIKAALAVHHGVVPPTLHCEEPHPLLESTRLRVVSKEEPWESSSPRRAAVNAFGFGGINAHVVIEAHGASASRGARAAIEPSTSTRVALYSAADTNALLADLAAGRESSGPGLARAVVFDPTPDRLARARAIVERGKAWRGREGVWFSPRAMLRDGGSVAFLFPGVDASFEPRVDDVARHFDLPLPAFTQAKNLEEIGIGIVALNRMLDGVLRGLGVSPSHVAGHSIGEWSAMIATGVIPQAELDAFVATLKPGTLEVPGVVFAAAGCGHERARAAIEGLSEIALSHDNCPHQVLICGKEASIDVALTRLKDDGILCQKLDFQSGFHSPLFAPFVEPHRRNFEQLPLRAPNAPLWSATTCARYPRDPDGIRALSIQHLTEPVRFRELIEALHAEGARVFVQVGTGSLVHFVEDTLRGKPHLAISANVKERSGLEQLQRTLAALFVEGADVDFARVTSKSTPKMMLSLGVPLVRAMTPLARPTTTAPNTPSTIEGSLAAEFAETMSAVADAQREVFATLAAPRSSRPKAGVTKSVRVLSVETMPELLDHSFFRQPEHWSVLSDRHPVVPMTTSIDLMMEHACALIEGRVAIAVEDVRAYRWLIVSTPVHVEVTCTYDGGDRVHVRFGDYCEGTVVLADRYEPAPALDQSPLVEGVPSAIDAKTLYAQRWMFHGPRYQGIVDVGVLGREGIRGTLETGAARGALLDNAGQLFGYWVMQKNELNRMAMPVQIAKLRFFGPHPRQGERLVCDVRVRVHDDKRVVADLSLGLDGRAWVTIEGWEDRRFETDPRLWAVMLWPEKSLLAVPQAEGFVLFEDRYRAAPTRDQLARRFLGEGERAEYERQGPRKQRAWLSGRIAAKDAVRALLFDRGEGPKFPVEIEIGNEPNGRPFARTNTAREVAISIAHKDDLAVAFAAEGRAVGIDVERIEPRDDSFAELSFTRDELKLVADEPRDLAFTRLWAAKEAAAKAAGTGLQGAPHRFPIRDRAGQRLLVGELWVDTKRHGDFVIAWTRT